MKASSLFFSDISASQRLKEFTYTRISRGCAFLDDDLDTKLDLLIVNGHIYPQVEAHQKRNDSYKQLPILLHNVEGKLTDVSRQSGPGLQQAESMRGLAVGDYDDDGKLDLLITAMDARPLLLRNEMATRGHRTRIRLLNRHGSPAINATATLTSGGVTQSRN
jgi:hypothetical protein